MIYFLHRNIGFRENCSTQHAILDIVNTIQNNIDKRLYSCGIFIDLKRPLTRLIISILLHKLHHYGIRGMINDWFSSYLSVRMQSTKIGSIVSSKERIVFGVPQGSVLGPIYVNGRHRSSKRFDFYLFADDTNLLYAEKDLNYLSFFSLWAGGSQQLLLSDWFLKGGGREFSKIFGKCSIWSSQTH